MTDTQMPCVRPILPIPDEYVQDGHFRENGGYQAMLRVLSLTEPLTAVFSANNLMTIGALKALYNMRVRVPENLSLISFDDLEVGELLSPALTCVTHDDIKQGTLDAQMLLAQLEKREYGMARRVMLDVQLVTRSSCAKPVAEN
jgi:LacI family transcriptional regulator